MKKDAITYNYWIYIFSCLFFMVVTFWFFRFRLFENKWELSIILPIFALNFVCSTLGWFIGKAYNLHYFWICGFGWVGMIFFSFLRLIFTDLHAPDRDLFIFFLFIGIPFSIFFIGGAIFIISYPFQVLYSNLLQNFKKLD